MRRSCSSRGRVRAAAHALACLLAAGCGTLTVPQEQQLGQQMAREMRGEKLLVHDDVVVDYVADIGERILRAAGPQPFAYQFYVVEDDDINAFALPGGQIAVHTGTILRASNVSELAGVIAHEVGHVAKRHIAKRYGQVRNAGIATDVATLAGSVFGMGGVANLGSNLLAWQVMNSFGREDEAEADAFAVDVLPAAGYSPDGLVTFFETMRAEGGGEPPAFLSDHPTTADRIEITRELIAAQPRRADLRVTDGGRLEIIQQRIRLLTGAPAPDPRRAPPPQTTPQQPRPPETQPRYEPL